MKKVLAIIAIVMLVPFTAFGMEMMADTALEDVTGQAGVSISIDNVQMDFQMGYLGWGDADGIDLPDSGGVNGTLDAAITAIESGGWVYMSQMQFLNIVIDKYAVGAAGITPLNANFYNGTTDSTVAFEATDLSPLTIDVGTIYTSFVDAGGGVWVPNVDPATGAVLKTGVRIGIPTLSIYVGTIAPFDISLVAYDGTGPATPADATAGYSDTLGTMAMGSIQLDTKGGSITIFAH